MKKLIDLNSKPKHDANQFEDKKYKSKKLPFMIIDREEMLKKISYYRIKKK